MPPLKIQARPKSRQSTTSIASNKAQPITQQEQHQFVAANVWQHQQQQHHQQQQQAQHQHEQAMAHMVQQQFPDTMVQMQHPIMPHPGMGYSMNAPPHLQMHHAFSHQPHHMRESPMPDGISDMGAGGTKNATNDNELRRLLRENETRSLENIAQQFQKDESTSKLEKLKQIFGMIWLMRNVRSAEGQTIPRNSVYNEYQYSCGDFRLPTLNPASFGKLVRIIFPKIATRRLGVRGASKYHYVGLTLLVDKNRTDKARMQVPLLAYEPGNQTDAAKPAPSIQSQPVNQPEFGQSVATHTVTPLDTNMRHNASATFYQPSFVNDEFKMLSHEATLLPRPLKFPEALDRLQLRDAKFELPDISPYLPPGTDEDAANSLVSVYRSHCILAIDNFRYCKTDKFSESFKSLVGLLTVPGQKLLASPSIAPWIRECDWRKYQSMIPMLNMIILTQVPQKATTHMQEVARNLCAWIQLYFASQPAHLNSSMLGPAGVFVSILERFCRVQNAALQVAPVLDSVEKRNSLWGDWVNFVNPLHVVQNSLAGWGHRRCRLILTREIQLLLSPSVSLPLEGTFFEDDGEGMTKFKELEARRECRNSSDFIARLYRFLLSVRSRFPSASSKEMLSTIERFTSNALRNMTLAGAQTVPEWWRLKVFIDEASYWLAEMGGLFENDSDILSPPINDLANETLYDFGGFDAVDSRPPTGKADDSMFDSPNPELSHTDSNSNGQPSRPASTAPGNQTRNHTSGLVVQKPSGLHEDSGIGLGMDDDFGMDDKFAGFGPQTINSDPADVVVC